MDDKLDKYMNGSINPEELVSLKKEIDKLDDKELDKIFNTRSSDIEFFESDIEAIRENLSTSIKDSYHESVIRRIIMGCAAALIPALIICGIFLFNYNRQIKQYDSFLSQQISLNTKNGEYSRVALPDGSEIDMGPKSDLSYSLNSFYKKNRIIHYNGEGTFRISKKDHESFILETSCFEIRVLGTEFSIISRAGEETSEVYLKKGSIQLFALASNESTIMKPGETAILSQATGAIHIFNDDNFKRTAGQPVMYFKASYIPDIVEKIELYYGVRIIGYEQFNDISFTGSLPTNNFSQLIYTLENTLKISLVYNEENNTLAFKR